jgi:hypothetical protein
VVFFTFARSAPAQVVFSFGSGYSAPSYNPWYGAAIRCDIASKVPVAWPESEYRSNDDSASKVLLSRYGIFFMRSPRNSVTTYVGLGSGAQVPTKGGVLENPNLGTCDALVSV